MNLIVMPVYVLTPFTCWWGQRYWEGIEEQNNTDRDQQLLVNQSHLQRRPTAIGNG